VEGMSKGRYMAVYYVATSSANVLAPIMGTSIYHHFGGANLWYFCIVLGVGLSFGYVLLLKRQDHFPPLPHTQAKARLHKR
jgi:MFS family permease